YELFRRVGGITGDITITEVEELFLPRLTDLVPSPFIDTDRASSGVDANFVPRPFVDIDHAAFVMDFSARMEASLTQMRQQINDTQSLAELAPVSSFSLSTGGGDMTAVEVAALGYWSPL